MATRDELWLRGRLIERRLSYGEAVEGEQGIVATDARDDALVAACDAEMDRLRRCVIPDARMRLVAEARHDAVTATMTVTIEGLSIVTTPEDLQDDLALLRSAIAEPVIAVSNPQLPIIWLNGTAAVLLHEALGHPREHGHDELRWPSWLSIDVPLHKRRSTFRDVPLYRMTTLIARQQNAPFELPEERIEVFLVAGGSYEPLTEMVTVRVAAANLVEGKLACRIAPFAIIHPRRAIARSIVGAYGDPIRYPGVICSREGQELVVGSYAPVMVTR